MTPTAARGFKHILCPIDFSRHSRSALRYAGVLAERNASRLTVLTVNDPTLAAATAAATRDATHLTATTMSELRRLVRRTLGPAGASAALEVAVGHSAEQINRIAKRLGVDLIVMGTHGLSGFRKWFFGSTTELVLRQGSVPVLAVPAQTRGAAETLRAFPGRTVLAPIDLDGNERSDARRAIDLARRLGSEALLLHVVKPAQPPPWLAADAGVLDRQRLEAAEKRMRGIADASSTRFRVAIGDPVDQIDAAAVQAKAQVIIMTLKRRGLLGPRRGSISYRVLCSGVAAVLAAPDLRN